MLEKIHEFNENAHLSSGNCLLVQKLLELTKDGVMVNEILKVIDGLCKNCWNNRSGCFCYKDE